MSRFRPRDKVCRTNAGGPLKYSTDIVVLDLEATCPDVGDNTIERSNIIDVGAVRLDKRTLEIQDVFSELVRPTDFEISPHIAEMTGIHQEMVAHVDDFGAVGRRFINWCGSRNRFVLAVFGAYYDIPLLRRDCRAHGIRFREHFVGGAIDIRALAMAWMAENHFNTTGITVAKALDVMGIEGEFTFHRALEDAKAEAAILKHFHYGDDGAEG